MRERIQKLILYLGVAWNLVWIALLLFKIFAFWPSVLYDIPGIILIWIGLYNWGAGTDFERRQEYPIENL